MNKQYPNLAKRGGVYQIRRRIPACLAGAYPSNKKEIGFSLKTSDLKIALKRLALATVTIDQEFAAKEKLLAEKVSTSVPSFLNPTMVSELSDLQIQQLAQSWTRSVILTDQHVRSLGMSDEEFDERGQQLNAQRLELGKMLAQGRIEPILPAFTTFCHLNHIDVQLTPEAVRKAGFTFLRAVVSGLDHQMAQQDGRLVDVDAVSPQITQPLVPPTKSYEGPSWAEVFDTWVNFVEGRPKSTIIASRTPWGQLERYSQQFNVAGPADLTPKIIADFVEQMKTVHKLTVKTINGRLGKLKEIFKVAVGKNKLTNNPAMDALGFKESSRNKAARKRLPFSMADLNVIFGGEVFTAGARSRGQSGEACYWIPIIMHYTGARPEEIAGLPTSDIKQDPHLGWYFEITDIESGEDAGLFDEDSPKKAKLGTEKRTLKNVVSRRKIPVAPELIELGLLRYLDFVRAKKSDMLFPSLERDFHDKLSGAFGKWFGRYKKSLGFNSPQKTLYSLRHNMKDLMEHAQIPSKYLKRILGHASGDGTITDGYGTGVPLEVIHEHFVKIRFPKIPAQPWNP